MRLSKIFLFRNGCTTKCLKSTVMGGTFRYCTSLDYVCIVVLALEHRNISDYKFYYIIVLFLKIKNLTCIIFPTCIAYFQEKCIGAEGGKTKFQIKQKGEEA